MNLDSLSEAFIRTSYTNVPDFELECFKVYLNNEHLLKQAPKICDHAESCILLAYKALIYIF